MQEYVAGLILNTTTKALYWIGLSDSHDEGKWRWVDDTHLTHGQVSIEILCVDGIQIVSSILDLVGLVQITISQDKAIVIVFFLKMYVSVFGHLNRITTHRLSILKVKIVLF